MFSLVIFLIMLVRQETCLWNIDFQKKNQNMHNIAPRLAQNHIKYIPFHGCNKLRDG